MDELTRQVAEICEDAYLTASTSFVPEDVAKHIIALVRADERKRIREALLDQDLLESVAEVAAPEVNHRKRIVEIETDTMMEFALSAIGLTETQGEKP